MHHQVKQLALSVECGLIYQIIKSCLQISVFSFFKITWSLLFECNAKSLILISGQTT